jgi:hypothetical protein
MKFKLKVYNFNQKGGSSLVTDDDPDLAKAIQKSLNYQDQQKKEEEEFQKILKRLAPDKSYEKYNVFKIPVRADGTCMFHSFAYFLGLGKSNGHILRDQLCFLLNTSIGNNYLDNLPDGTISILQTNIEGEPIETEVSKQDYASSICKPSSWGGNLELAMIKFFLDCKININNKNYNLFGLPYQKYNIILWNGAAIAERVFTNIDLSTFNSPASLTKENSIILHYNGSHYEILRHVTLFDKEPTVQQPLEGFNYHILEKKPTLCLTVSNLDSKPPPRPPRPSTQNISSRGPRLWSRSKKTQSTADRQMEADRKMAKELAKELEQTRQQEATDLEYAKRLANQ